jgi:hypothetical protein
MAHKKLIASGRHITDGLELVGKINKLRKPMLPVTNLPGQEDPVDLDQAKCR